MNTQLEWQTNGVEWMADCAPNGARHSHRYRIWPFEGRFLVSVDAGRSLVQRYARRRDGAGAGCVQRRGALMRRPPPNSWQPQIEIDGQGCATRFRHASREQALQHAESFAALHELRGKNITNIRAIRSVDLPNQEE
jgi:hypothetical protein